MKSRLDRNIQKKENTNTELWGGTYAWARFDNAGNGNFKFWWYPEGNYQVLATDYTSYALVYGCDTWFGIFYTN